MTTSSLEKKKLAKYTESVLSSLRGIPAMAHAGSVNSKEKPFTALRNRLCSQYADSEEQRLCDLISGMQLGDRKPSRLLLEMRSKTGNRMTEELLKSLFLQRLPTHVQQILAISNDQLEKLAEKTGGIMAVVGHTSSIDA
ncbi:retrovirus-related Pol polyprotein from transposon 297 [Nephila pilipes]|uniref:Retrovirus-related Pol polyprotein from transposon 297 n=1 Tax=Nephila pilipes TaxID=299642 RepID=A0A8X6TH62_NEPPI|nr:retrovirus-related Pol polyprotein from transposon 297 [Nephila pilipes]